MLNVFTGSFLFGSVFPVKISANAVTFKLVAFFLINMFANAVTLSGYGSFF